MTRLLIVEDDPIIAADLRLAMNKMGYEVLDTVESGEEAIARVRQEQPDLILMDIKMPRMSGIQAAILIQMAEIYRELGDYENAEELLKRAELSFHLK